MFLFKLIYIYIYFFKTNLLNDSSISFDKDVGVYPLHLNSCSMLLLNSNIEQNSMQEDKQNMYIYNVFIYTVCFIYSIQ